MEHFLTVKEMAKVSRVSARNLRYYDEIGLFTASGTLDNGYRYYTLDKIEEIHTINYFRHLGISIKEIKELMSVRDVKLFQNLMEKELTRIQKEIENYKMMEGRIKRRLRYLNQFENLPELNTIFIQELDEKRILRQEVRIKEQKDFEYILTQFEQSHNLPPSMFIGDLGFYVDLNIEREEVVFDGMFLLAEDPYYETATHFDFTPKGKWLSIYLKGDHSKALEYYPKLLSYAKEHGLQLADYALERTLMDQIISTNHDDCITEILILIKNR